MLLGKNNCLECNNIYYCIYLIVKEDKANAVIGYLERINMMHYRTQQSCYVMFGSVD